MKDHVVRQGECLTSLADEYGFFWETLWKHDKNSQLKEKRQNPNMLLPGDVVHIPDKREKVESCAIGQAHKFKLKGIPALFRVQLFQDGQPRANQDYVLVIDHVELTGKSDGDGVVEAPMPATAHRATLVIGPDQKTMDFTFGQLPPITEIEGVQARLNNLGFPCGASGKLDDETKTILRNFQTLQGLTVSGDLDDETRAKIETLHDDVGAVEEAAAGGGA